MRKATVEIDKVTGTRFPPEKVTKDDKEHTLRSIYADAGVDLDVQMDQADLPLPATGENFELPHLHEYMTRYRKAQRDGWYAHSEPNKSWLMTGPAEFVMPGGRPFTDRPDDASTLARGEAIETTPGLALEISVRADTFDLGEPLYLRVTLRNDTIDSPPRAAAPRASRSALASSA